MIANDDVRKHIAGAIDASIFFVSQHRAIFAALTELVDRELSYTPSTLKSFMPADDSWGGVEYLDKLERMAIKENLDYHISKAKWDSVRNTLLTNKIPELQAMLQDPRVDQSEMYKKWIGLASTITPESQALVLSGTAHIARYQATLYARQSGMNTRTTGYMALDKKLTSPCNPGWISVIAAAPSIGKTTFALNMATRQARKWRVGYLPWESGAVAATDIICASQLKIPLYKLLKNPEYITKEEHLKIEELLDGLFNKNNNFSFLPKPPKSVTLQKSSWTINDAVLDWLNDVLKEWQIDILYWDLFEKKFADRQPQAIAWALDRVQEIAQDRGVHFSLLHQITLKDAEKQQDKRPTRANLKGSGAYIEVPDFVFGLYRRAVYEQGIEDTELELYCLKQRLGAWPFKIIFDWEGKYCRVSGGRERQLTCLGEDEEV